MARMTPYRHLIALLLAALMPFCCCSLHILMTACESCTGNGSGAPCHGDGEGSDHNLEAGPHHDEDGTPAQPKKPGHDNGPCTCDKQKQTTIGVEKTTIDLPTPVLAYVLPAWDANTLPHGHFMVSFCENRALQRPATSLLRQHCALIV